MLLGMVLVEHKVEYIAKNQRGFQHDLSLISLWFRSVWQNTFGGVGEDASGFFVLMMQE